MLTPTPFLPALNTEIIEPLFFLERHFLENRQLIRAWLDQQWQKTMPPVYGSIDLRNAGFKLAPIDMNLFPAGFNNLNPAFLPHAIAAAKKTIEGVNPTASSILIIPESHTRNIFYWENIYTLQTILNGAGFDVRFGMLGDVITAKTAIDLPLGSTIVVEPLQRVDNELRVGELKPDVVLLNNDLSAGIPAILQHLNHPLLPPAELGWSQRLKSAHFQYYAEVTAEFSDAIKLDPWLITPLFRHCGQIDFMNQEGLECLITNAEILMEAVKKKYEEYNITHQPFLIVKADAGTYGMAVMTVRNIDELRQLNRKQRTRMSTIKGNQPVNRVIIQEGVYSFETIGEEKAVAEPVIYLWGNTVVGGFYRVNKDRKADENLNAPGMAFESLAFAEPCNNPCADVEPDACQNRFYLYGIVAELSMLAAAREIQDQVIT